MDSFDSEHSPKGSTTLAYWLAIKNLELGLAKFINQPTSIKQLRLVLSIGGQEVVWLATLAEIEKGISVVEFGGRTWRLPEEEFDFCRRLDQVRHKIFSSPNIQIPTRKVQPLSGAEGVKISKKVETIFGEPVVPKT